MTTFQQILFVIDVLLAVLFSTAVIVNMAEKDKDMDGHDYLKLIAFIALFTLQAMALYKG